MTDCADDELSASICRLAMKHDDPYLLRLAARLAFNHGDLENADILSSKMLRLDPPEGRSLRCEYSLRNNHAEEALALARYNYSGDVDSGMALGMCLLETYHVEDARECFERTKESMISGGCVYRLDELLMYDAMADICMKDHESARANIDTAISLTKNDKRRETLLNMNASLEHRVLLE